VKKFLAVMAVIVCLTAGSRMGQAQASAQSGAQTAPQAGGVNGKWHFILDTPGGDRDIDAEFTVDADGKVSGIWGKTTAAGTFKDGNLNLAFEYHSDESGDTDQMKIVGKLDDPTSISGTWQFASYDGAFKAIRPKN
jgi:hypothetical protein